MLSAGDSPLRLAGDSWRYLERLSNLQPTSTTPQPTSKNLQQPPADLQPTSYHCAHVPGGEPTWD